MRYTANCFMKRRQKRPIGKTATNESARTVRLPWLLVPAVIVGLAVLSTRSNFRGHRVVEQLPGGPKTESSGAVGKEVNGAPSVSTDVFATNDPDQSYVDRAADLLNSGTELLARGKIDEAVAHYEQAVKLNPEDEDSHYNLALALAKQGNRAAAEEEYLEALRIYPDYAEAHNNLGNLLAADGRLEQAIAHFKEALLLSPDNASAHNNLGNALARQGKIAEAISCFREALGLKPDYLEARYNLGSAYLAQKRLDEAISEFTDILRRRPDFVPAQRRLSEARALQTK